MASWLNDLWFFADTQVEIYNRLGTAPVPQKNIQYWRGTSTVLAKARPTTDAAPKVNLAESCISLLARYWTSVPCQDWNLYWFSTGITPKSVVSWQLVSGLGLYYASTAPTLGPVPTVHTQKKDLIKSKKMICLNDFL